MQRRAAQWIYNDRSNLEMSEEIVRAAAHGRLRRSKAPALPAREIQERFLDRTVSHPRVSPGDAVEGLPQCLSIFEIFEPSSVRLYISPLSL